MEISKKIYVAIDNPDFVESFKLAELVKDKVAGVKLGLEFFCANGPEAIKKFRTQNINIFLDLKLHDIPNTVANAFSQICELGVDIITIHASGGSEMMQATLKARTEFSRKNPNKKTPLIFAVTVLTSMDEDDFSELNINNSIKDQVIDLAKLAYKAGLDGVVCSSHEVEFIKENTDKDFLTITPGIRLESEIKQGILQDQKRVLSPLQAIKNGSDFLVIGRSITQNPNPISVLEIINKEQ